jgi:hypothetical protein
VRGIAQEHDTPLVPGLQFGTIIEAKLQKNKIIILGRIEVADVLSDLPSRFSLQFQ